MTTGNSYIIPFKGLALGIHEFEWVVGAPFFGMFPESEILDGSLNVQVTLNKKSQFLELDFRLQGQVRVPCDRCLDPVAVPVDYESTLIAGFGASTHEETEDLIVLAYEEHELDVKQFIYEYAHLSLPFRKVHGDDAQGHTLCNPDMIKKLEEYLVECPPEEEDTDDNETEFVNN